MGVLPFGRNTPSRSNGVARSDSSFRLVVASAVTSSCDATPECRPDPPTQILGTAGPWQFSLHGVV